MWVLSSEAVALRLLKQVTAALLCSACEYVCWLTESGSRRCSRNEENSTSRSLEVLMERPCHAGTPDRGVGDSYATQTQHFKTEVMYYSNTTRAIYLNRINIIYTTLIYYYNIIYFWLIMFTPHNVLTLNDITIVYTIYLYITILIKIRQYNIHFIYII